MARLQLNKSSLARQSVQLRTYLRFLPSLDLKRQQLMGERAKAAAVVVELAAKVEALAEQVGRDVPMLGNDTINLNGIVRLKSYKLSEENVVGTKLPRLEKIDVEVASYSPLTKPHWVDDVARLIHDMLEVRLQLQIARERLALLEMAVDKITQRINLFDKVLIPGARANIKKIQIYLNEQEMASVVRSKIAKKKRVPA